MYLEDYVKKVSGFVPSVFPVLFRTAAVLVAFSLVFLSCDSGGSDDGDVDEEETESVVDVSYPADSNYTAYPTPVIKVTAENNPVKLEGLTGQNVFLVKANVSKDWKQGGIGLTGTVESFTVNDTAYVRSDSAHDVSFSEYPSLSSRESPASRIGAGNRAVSGKANGITRLDHEAARKLSASALPASFGRARSAGRSASAGTGPSYSYSNGDTKDFWVQDGVGAWVQINAVLRAQGENCYIWVATANYNAASSASNDNMITEAQATAVKARFDAMYPLVTNLLGYENGGGLAVEDENYGGVDGDPKVSVLVYDIGADYTALQDAGILGFFWGKDYYEQEDIDEHSGVFGSGVKTNLAEIFYVDSHFTDFEPDYIYSTLIHEYQHMINFARKNLPSTDNPDGLIVESWFNEMLSMLAEDVIGPLIDIDSRIFPLNSRMPYFLGHYSESGVTDWLGGDGVYSSYVSAYAFGAFLARNYGGSALVQEILDCPYANREAVSFAINGMTDSSSFENAFRRYGETLVFSGQAAAVNSSLATFDRTVSSPVSEGNPDPSYTFFDFDIWTMTNIYAGEEGIPADYCGPIVWVLGDYALRPYGLDLQSNKYWQGVNGTLEIDFDLPLTDDVELYVMVR